MPRASKSSKLLPYLETADVWAKLHTAMQTTPLTLNVVHVAASGMSRVICVYGVIDGQIRNLSEHVARVTGHRYDEKRKGIRMDGVGMNMGFALMNDLGYYWVKFACPDVLENPDIKSSYGRFANNHSRWDSDTGEFTPPWPIIIMEADSKHPRARANWEWL